MTVAILDPNRFLAQGIKQLLVAYLHARGITVRFVGKHNAGRADLVFLSVSKSQPALLCLQSSEPSPPAPMYIALQAAPRGEAFSPWGTCVRVLGCLGSRAQSTALLGLVAQALQHLEDRVTTLSQYCPQCVNTNLTEREVEVMYCMARGIAQKQLSQRLHISIKTVSAHKRSVMRKLGFRRNAELYHWLWLGGLEQIKRP
ncbi:helix-turn-helix transcriptional regulator [Serratia ureilytica]|uniref:helix-turn-helix transcriptional regulator n=1 Tax=Serratia ureilytica TaxID=300181 RepID=UPI0018D68DC3|nr:LuxR C-terminal-related transcriptional regulator [Serratia ureilytica]MBH3008169.1 hypothetical protein [Serratia ureilytica]MBH3022817.1 hypothetical protein [Serratia ureilytica]MBH3108696.1 hypothetical protein [Serratia ureilytica]MBH3176090.1 hypothetical protein [Serratia ureilytica]QQU62264.1 hypothetical protein I6I46_19580 [Serratia ureilytica]